MVPSPLQGTSHRMRSNSMLSCTTADRHLSGSAALLGRTLDNSRQQHGLVSLNTYNKPGKIIACGCATLMHDRQDACSQVVGYAVQAMCMCLNRTDLCTAAVSKQGRTVSICTAMDYSHT